MKNTLLALLGFIFLTTPLVATAQQFGDFTYTSNGSGVTITHYTGSGGAVAIPDTINGLPVTIIGNNAFRNQFSLTSVTIPASVTSIGSDAFFDCISLASVTIPGGVTSIGDFAFYYCPSLTNVIICGSVTTIGREAFESCAGLTSVTIPASVTSIGDGAFWYCSSLMAITVDAANAFYSSADGVLFNRSLTTLIQYPGGKAGSYLIPGSVTNIGDAAFVSCNNLTGVTIPGSVVSIGHDAFLTCYSLTSVTIPRSVTAIGDYAFRACISLRGVFFQGNAPTVGPNPATFSATVYYLPGTTGWGATLGDALTSLWNPLMQSSGAGPDGFGFNITGTADIPVVIEAATNPANTTWVPLRSLNLTNGAFYFSDPNWTNYPARSYRIRSP